ncbi:MAG: PhoH family protein [bacterium]|nr:PhoH family protein [bacterium]
MSKDSLTSINGPVRHERKYQFRNKELFRQLCGVADAGIGALEELLQVNLIPRGHSFLIHAAAAERAEFAAKYFEVLEERYGAGDVPLSEDFSDFDVRYLYRTMKGDVGENSGVSNSADAPDDSEDPREPDHALDRADVARKSRASSDRARFLQNSETVFKTVNGKPIKARTERQAEYVASLLQHEVTICMGPAGTGKTFLSIAAACRMFINGDKERLVLTRPAVEAGESLGYLPGDLVQKVDPYLRPLYDALYECLGTERVHDLINTRKIEIAPLAFMRGRTLNDSVVVLDEAQNCTLAQIKMFLTRLGRNSCMCLSGDVTQVDLPRGKSGLPLTIKLLENIPGIGVVRFSGEDIIRNPLIEQITRAFENYNPGEQEA